MYNSDKPINELNDDVLGRKVFAKQLANAILSFNSEDSFTIGLYGKWGSGKTSIINMMQKEIDERTKDIEEDAKPVIVNFAPWNFSDSTQLINQFFTHLKNKLIVKDRSELTEKLGRVLEAYSDAFDYAEAIPVVGKYMSGLFKMTSQYAAQGLQDKPKDILTQKEKLIEVLKEQNRKIVVIIDDIDRLSNEQIRLIFKLVNSVAGLPNIMYLLSMDKDIVVRALEAVQNCNGEEYLEKMVQVPFDIPDINKDKLFELFLSKFYEVLTTKGLETYRKVEYIDILTHCIEPFIKNIRDINRIINTFKFKFDMVHKEINPVDLMAVTAIQVLEPKLIEWMIINKENICGSIKSNYGYSDNNSKKYLEDFKHIDENKANDLLNAISSLFPRVIAQRSLLSREFSDKDLLFDKRIACIKKFDLYINLDINSISIQTDVITNSIKYFTKGELNKLLDNLIEEEKVYDYFKSLVDYISLMPKERVKMFIDVFLATRSKLVNEFERDDKLIFTETGLYKCIYYLINFIESKHDKFLIYKKILENADSIMYERIFKLIMRIEGEFKEIEKNCNARKEIQLELEDFCALKEEFVDKFIDVKDALLDLDNIIYILELIKEINTEKFIEYKNIILNNPISKLKLVIKCATKSFGGEDVVYYFKESNYSKYATKNDVLQTLNEVIGTEKFNDFTEDEKVRLAYLELNKNRSFDNKADVCEVLELLKKWEEK
ncbi:MAG: hypothetical protein E7214_16935 [Clostridium sp.]|nr:hypothetical protein [Clostridium sp.]